MHAAYNNYSVYRVYSYSVLLLDDVKKISILKHGVGIEGQKVRKQVKDQRSMETNKDGAQVMLENKNK